MTVHLLGQHFVPDCCLMHFCTWGIIYKGKRSAFCLCLQFANGKEMFTKKSVNHKSLFSWPNTKEEFYKRVKTANKNISVIQTISIAKFLVVTVTINWYKVFSSLMLPFKSKSIVFCSLFFSPVRFYDSLKRLKTQTLSFGWYNLLAPLLQKSVFLYKVNPWRYF